MKYDTIILYGYTEDYEVTADNEEEAREKARKRFLEEHPGGGIQRIEVYPQKIG